MLSKISSWGIRLVLARRRKEKLTSTINEIEAINRRMDTTKPKISLHCPVCRHGSLSSSASGLQTRWLDVVKQNSLEPFFLVPLVAPWREDPFVQLDTETSFRSYSRSPGRTQRRKQFLCKKALHPKKVGYRTCPKPYDTTVLTGHNLRGPEVSSGLDYIVSAPRAGFLVVVHHASPEFSGPEVLVSPVPVSTTK